MERCISRSSSRPRDRHLAITSARVSRVGVGTGSVGVGRGTEGTGSDGVRVGTGLVGEERLAVLESECTRLVALGAVRGQLLVADGVNESCQVMQDVEGNEFCLD